MPKNYKTYTAPGSFSEFQIKVPDQTAKIEQQTEKQVQGLKRARSFQKENEEIYLRAQRLVNSAEDANRDTNFQMQTLERQSYKDALDRDYTTQLNNLDAENKANQKNLENISAFSTTAFQMVGDYMEQQEQQKVAAAHDIISRTGVTYDQMLAFQKMDDNLTRSEFAAQDIVQQMFGPNADQTNMDGMFAVYQNRNTKRWVEHKQLLQNTLNGFPDFMEMRINEIQQQTGQTITDFDPVLAQIKREFMEANFVGTARPEVLSGAGVYAKLDQLVNNRRTLFLKDRRTLQEKELSQDRQRSFADAFNREGVVGLLKWNSTNPSYQKRQDLKAYLLTMSKVSGAYAFDDTLIDSILDYEGGGSNGQTLRQSFPIFAAELEDIQNNILDRERQDAKREDDAVQREFDDYVTTQLNAAGADGELTAKEVRGIVNQATLLPRFFGVSTDIGNDAMRITSDAQRWRKTEETLNFLHSKGRLTVEMVKGGFFETPQKMQAYMNLAQAQQQVNQDPLTKQHLSEIESAVLESPEVRGSVSAYGNLNEINHTLYVDKVKQNYNTYYQQFAAEGASLNKARENAKLKVLSDIDKAFKNPKIWSGDRFTEFSSSPPDQQQLQTLETRLTTGKDNMKKIGDIVTDASKSPEERYKLAAGLMNQAEVANALLNFSNRQFDMPPIIRYIGEKTFQTPLQVLNNIAPYIGDGSLTLSVNELNRQQKALYKDFEVTPYTPLRIRNRTPERTGRANVGDTKTAASAPVRPSMFKVVQYVSGDPAIRGKTDGRIVYDNGDGPRGHGGKNYHNHYEFATQDQAAAAKLLFERNGYRVTSYLRPNDTGSAHSRGVAIDVAPPLNLPYTDEAEAEWSARANALIGFDPLENE